MATYLEKITAAQKGIDSTYGLLNIYKNSRSNNGWIGTNPSDINLSKFNTYFSENNIVKLNDSIDATLFDIPMSTRGYDKYGNFGAGIPSDIGFTRNVEQDENGMYLPHSPLYQVVNTETIELGASKTANATIGGIVKYTIVDDGIEVFPNGSSESFISRPPSYDIIFDTDTLFPIIPKENANHMNMLYCFVSVNAEADGVVLYTTPNFIDWNTHIILDSPNGDAIVESIWMDIFNGYGTDQYGDSFKYTRDQDNAVSNIESVLARYFSILPNNNYLIMDLKSIINEINDGVSGYTLLSDKFNIAKMYSPLIKEPIMSIVNPYQIDSTDDAHILINGFSSFMTENGEIVLYLNYESENKTPLVLYNGRTMGTFIGEVSDNYKHEIIESPKVAKIYDMQIDKNNPYTKSIDNMAMDCSISILESKNGKLTNNDIPAASVQLALGDIGRPYEDKMYDAVSLYVDKNIDMMDNVDVDFSDYIYSKNIIGKDYLSNIENNNLWTEVIISDTVNSWRSVCYGNGKYVAVGDSNIFAYSTDGITWIEGTISDTPRRWISICYGNDKFVAVGDSNIFAYSTDGIHWTEGTISDTYRYWISVCYGDGKYIAVCGENIFAYSTDGINWIEDTISDTSRNWKSICYGNGKYVVVAFNSNVFAYSTDGITWIESNISDTIRDWHSVCYGNNKFVAVGSNSNIFAYSTDGINWTEGTISDTKRYWHSVCYGNNKFVAVGSNSNIFAYSTDGINWTEGTISDTDRYWNSVCYGNGKFVAVAPGNVFIILDSINLSTHSNISNNNKLTIFSDPSLYRGNVRYRSSIIGNTLVSNLIKDKNNPSLGSLY